MESIKLTNGQIEGIIQAKGTIETIKVSLPLKPAYWLARAIEKMRDLYKIYKGEQQSIIDAHALKKEDGTPQADSEGRVLWAPGQEQIAGEKLKELAEIEEDLGINKIDISKASDNFSVENMLILMPLITEPKFEE